MSSWLPFLKLKGLLAPEISKFTKICKFQKNLYANLRLLNDHELIISVKTNKKAYRVCMLYLQNCRCYKHAKLLSHFSAHTEMVKYIYVLVTSPILEISIRMHTYKLFYSSDEDESKSLRSIHSHLVTSNWHINFFEIYKFL